MPILQRLFCYPLKSGVGLPLAHASVEPLGLEHDRRWLAVRPDGSFLTGRELPSLVLVRAVPSPAGLHLSAPGMPDLQVPFPSAAAPRLDVTVWGDTCSAARTSAAADAWFSTYLEQPTALVYMDARSRRPVDPRYAASDDLVSFADGFPLLLLSEASLADLNQRLPQPVSMSRFRPNLVVAGCEAFAEDGWRRLRIGTVELDVVKPCARCLLTTVDPETAQKDPHQEPLRTLTTFRRIEGKVMFGQNVLVRRAGTVRVGDTVELLGIA